MNSFQRKCSIFVFSCFIFASCNKNIVSTNTGTNIYIAGDNGTNPVLWKNGTAEILSSSIGSASQVIISGNDVYIAGVDGESSDLIPAGPSGQYLYWKNGIQNNIGSLRFLLFYSAISVIGNNVYYSNSNLWENGIMIVLPGQGSGHIVSSFAIGNDLYVAGSDSVGDAVYWKNGKLNVVAQGYYPTYNSGSDPSVSCMYVSGNDVYIGGTNIDNIGVYWKNGEADYLQSSTGNSDIANVRSIFVLGNDVFIAGSIFSGSNIAPVYWKNGIQNILPLNGATYGSSLSIFVSGYDIYVAGYTSDGAVYWKNGIETVLSSQGNANSIYVH
jgi:hypothetical protein